MYCPESYADVLDDDVVNGASSEGEEDIDVPGLVVNANGEEEYKVEKILTKKLIKGNVYYRIKWVGWESAYNTWEPLENLKNCLVMVDEFEDKLKKLSAKNNKASTNKKTGSSDSEESNDNQDDDTVDGPLEPNSQDSELQPQKEAEEAHEMEEKFDSKIMGPLFRRIWRHSEVPICVLASTVFEGCLLHLVRIRKRGEVEEQTAEEDPFVGINENNIVIVVADYFNCQFPDHVIKFYEDGLNLKFSSDANDIVDKAARAMIVHNYRKYDVNVNRKEIFKDMMPQPQPVGRNDHVTSSDVLNGEKSSTTNGTILNGYDTDDVLDLFADCDDDDDALLNDGPSPKKPKLSEDINGEAASDKFGLPAGYESSDGGHSTSGSSDDDYEYEEKEDTRQENLGE